MSPVVIMYVDDTAVCKPLCIFFPPLYASKVASFPECRELNELEEVSLMGLCCLL